jgi:uncharacterized alkaline shock family protein YloU
MQRMPERSAAGRSFASRRAIEEIVRAAVLGSYGVVGFVDDDRLGRLRRLVGLGGSGVRVRTVPSFSVDLRLTVAFGLPVAEVARQVDSAVRYALRRALAREPDRLTIHVGRLRYEPSSVPPSSLPGDGNAAAADVGQHQGGGQASGETSESVRR